MTRTVLVKGAAGAPSWLASEPTEDTPVYVISSKHGLLAHVSYLNRQLETVWSLPSEYRTFNPFFGGGMGAGGGGVELGVGGRMRAC